jgi:hypothetical protein
VEAEQGTSGLEPGEVSGYAKDAAHLSKLNHIPVTQGIVLTREQFLAVERGSVGTFQVFDLKVIAHTRDLGVSARDRGFLLLSREVD